MDASLELNYFHKGLVYHFVLLCAISVHKYGKNYPYPPTYSDCKPRIG